MPYYTATVCENGHTINNSEVTTDTYCGLCGAKCISQCPECGTSINGKEHLNGRIIASKYKPPLYCYKCGTPFPWTSKSIEVIQEILADDEELDNIIAQKLSESLKDIIVETPRTNLAINRLKKVMQVAGKFTADALKQFIIDFACEVVKKQFNLI